jgi:DNA-binding CsgD family transcriptional regulator
VTTERERDDHGRFHIDEAELEARRAQVVKLHVDGNSFREIGRKLGIRESTAHGDFRAVLDRTRSEANSTVEEERRVSLDRIDRAMLVLMPKVDAGDLEAMDRLDKLEKRRAALLGLDAPVKTQLDATVASHEVSPAAAARLVQERFGKHAAKRDPEPALPDSGAVSSSTPGA